MNEVYVRLLPLPLHVRAFTVPDAQGDYNVYVNSRLTFAQRRKSLSHELCHIRRGDFSREDAAAVIERELKEEEAAGVGS